MEEVTSVNDRVLLVDSYSDDSRRLHESLKQAGISCPVYTLEEDGFLPEGVMSAYGYFLGDYSKKEGGNHRPRYFNEIEAPEFWEISGSASGGSIHNLNQERAKIFYAEPKHNRFVRVVDWYDDKGVVSYSDHYNQYGFLYARTIFNAKGQKVNKTYFSTDGRVAVEENFVTKTMILTEGNKITMFSNKMKFYLYFAEKAGLQYKKVYYNTLSTPFFISQALSAEQKGDVLFWQEPERGDIPGNMTSILNRTSPRTRMIYVQNRAAYEKMLALGADPSVVKQLGYIYPFVRENGFKKEALICTNSDQVEHLKELAEALPDVKFHVAALTEMSSKLMSFGTYTNISLYPNVKMKVLDMLFETCDIYLDINQGSEIVSAVYKAFLQNQMIFAFKETLHQMAYVEKSQIYPVADYEKLIMDLRVTLADQELWKAKLQAQRGYALSEDAKAYKEALK